MELRATSARLTALGPDATREWKARETERRGEGETRSGTKRKPAGLSLRWGVYRGRPSGSTVAKVQTRKLNREGTHRHAKQGPVDSRPSKLNPAIRVDSRRFGHGRSISNRPRLKFVVCRHHEAPACGRIPLHRSASLLLAGVLLDGPARAAQFTLARQFLRFSRADRRRDFGGDGRPDFVAAAGPTVNGSMTNVLFRNTGELTFARQPVAVPEIIYGWRWWRTWTGTARRTRSGADGSTAWATRPNGCATSPETSRRRATRSGRAVAVADLDNDGDADLVTIDFTERGARSGGTTVRGRFTPGRSRVGNAGGGRGGGGPRYGRRHGPARENQRASGDGVVPATMARTFCGHGPDAPVSQPSAASWADYDGDGRLDVLLSARDVEGPPNWELAARVLLQQEGLSVQSGLCRADHPDRAAGVPRRPGQRGPAGCSSSGPTRGTGGRRFRPDRG